MRVHTVVVSVQHSEDISLEDMRSQITEKIVKVSPFFPLSPSSFLYCDIRAKFRNVTKDE